MSAILLAMLAGCQAPIPPAHPTEIVVRIPDREGFIDATLSLLRRYQLPPAYVDREAGRIVTARTASAQWFELWRIDAPGAYQTLESSLHTIGRVARITLEPAAGQSLEEIDAAAEAGWADFPPARPGAAESGAREPDDVVAATPPAEPGVYRLAVEVEKARLSVPERQITTASGALGLYSVRVPAVTGVRGTDAPVAWVPLGRDGDLEALLLAKLVRLQAEIDVVD